MRSLTLNGSVPTWPKCLACALSDRSFSYTSSNRSSECQACFNTWCWNYQDNTTRPNEYEPVIGSVPSFLTANNLIKSGSTSAPSSSSSASGQNAAAVSSSAAAATSSKSAGRRRTTSGEGVASALSSGMGLGLMGAGAVFGAMAVLA